jgi:hypothetical protein
MAGALRLERVLVDATGGLCLSHLSSCGDATLFDDVAPDGSHPMGPHPTPHGTPPSSMTWLLTAHTVSAFPRHGVPSAH